MSQSFAALLLLAFATTLCAQDAAVPPLEGTVIRRLGTTNWRSAVELHAPASPAGDSLARLRRVQVERQEEKPAVDRHGDPRPRTHADKESAVTVLIVSGNGCNGCQLRLRPGAPRAHKPWRAGTFSKPARCRG